MRALREFVIKPDGTQRRASTPAGRGWRGARKRKREERKKKIIRYRIDEIIDITGSLALYKRHVLNARVLLLQVVCPDASVS